jgi:RNA polymerase sigma-70 factor, ECF subfamily
MTTMSRRAPAPPAADPKPQTFEDFFDEHRRSLFHAMWLVTRDRSEAEELSQDAFLRVWERWDRVRTMDDPGAYLYRAAMNLARNRWRRAATALRRGTRLSTPRDDMSAVDDRDVVVRALGGLTPRERAAVVLTHYVGLSSEEAAVAMHVSASTVRVLATRGRAKVRGELGDDDA